MNLFEIVEVFMLSLQIALNCTILFVVFFNEFFYTFLLRTTKFG